MEGQVPGREPGVLPLVRHRHDVERIEVAPPGVPARQALRRGHRLGRIPVQPAGDVVVEQLLAPQQPGERLAHHQRLVGARAGRGELGVELVRLGLPLRHYLAELGTERVVRLPAGRFGGRRPQPQPHLGRLAGLDRQLVPERALGAGALGIDGGRPADHVVVDAVLRIRRERRGAEQPLVVGLVLAEQRGRDRPVRPGAGQQLQRAGERMIDTDRRVTHRPQLRLRRVHIPGPGVAEPRGRQHVQGGRLRSGVGHLHGHQQVIGAGLGVVHLGDPVPVVVERPGIQQLVLRLLAVTRPVRVDEVLIGERALRVVITPPVPRVARQRVQVPPVLLHVLAVVALRPGQPERPLLEDRVLAVPQGQPQAQPLLHIAEPGQPILPPAVGPGPRVIMRQVIPRLAVRAVVLAHRAPLPLADIRSPLVPLARLAQPVLQPPEPIHPIPLSTHGRPLSPRRSAASLTGRQPRAGAVIWQPASAADPDPFLSGGQKQLITCLG